MKRNTFITVLAAVMMMALLAACGADETHDANEGASGSAADVVTTASLVDNGKDFANGVSEDGRWIVSVLNDIAIDEEVVVAGTFYDKDDKSKNVYRKISLYAQDENHNITDSYTLTVPKLIIRSENLRIQGGTVKGDVVVEANGFNLHETAKIDGNVYFANDAFKASAAIDGEVTGTQTVQ